MSLCPGPFHQKGAGNSVVQPAKREKTMAQDLLRTRIEHLWESAYPNSLQQLRHTRQVDQALDRAEQIVLQTVDQNLTRMLRGRDQGWLDRAIHMNQAIGQGMDAAFFRLTDIDPLELVN